MPFQSKAQVGKMHVLEEEGKVPKGTSHRWAHETPGGIGNLPKHKKKNRGKYSHMRNKLRE